jgi:hypothetical protein
MNCTRLKQTWKPIYEGFERGADALFNLADAPLKTRHSRCRNCRCRRWVHVIFLHGGSAARDGTQQDDECHERQWRKKRQRRVLCGEQNQEGVVA